MEEIEIPGLNVHADQDDAVPTSKKKWNRGPKVILAVSLLLLIPVIGTSLASSVTVNGGAVTFGQGYTAALACDQQVTITPNAKFNYYSPPGYWYVDQITISGINTSPNAIADGPGCAGKTIRLQAMNSGDVVTGGLVQFALPTTGTAPVTVNCASPAIGIAAGCFTSRLTGSDELIIPLAVQVDATIINGFTIEQSDSL